MQMNTARHRIPVSSQQQPFSLQSNLQPVWSASGFWNYHVRGRYPQLACTYDFTANPNSKILRSTDRLLVACPCLAPEIKWLSSVKFTIEQILHRE